MALPFRAAARHVSLRASTTRPRRCIHTTIAQHATPIAHPPATGPPPEPPTPAVSEAQDRVARKLKQAELLRRGQAIRANPAKPATALQKRFWKDSTVKETPEGYQVMLDTRPVRTASKDILVVPSNKHALAIAIALEWDQLVSAQQALKNHYIPLTSLTSRAMDLKKADEDASPNLRRDLVQMLMRYLSTDTLLCWAPERNIHDAVGLEQRGGVESLRQLQIRTAKPIISHLTSHVWPGVEIQPTLDPNSIMPLPQPEATRSVIQGWLSGLPAFELAGLERAVLATKSLLVSARLLVEWSQEFSHLRKDVDSQKRFGIEEAAEASTLEVSWQTKMWGEVDDTHDVDKEDIRRQLGSTILLVNGSSKSP
ncbi:ATP12-domain-containing protein [Pseudovirgaria hyperparasitica]|uniref:ATP12-domain-containing protein n=1 Tax=Pseudovirgaria hyperparasitica TaxID=470096 RepID=A0A6A6W2R9_9PEZI|nr:ATP12-domain-containing protein [Pseudovirgaria hyperparasitica]KAF2756855.1 ATP12-domain-containing protein [Pseudovirgaria hyperparasitica]